MVADKYGDQGEDDRDFKWNNYIRRYCETDVMNTCLLYCCFQKMRGGLLEAGYDRGIALVKETLGNLSPVETDWDEYLKAWG